MTASAWGVHGRRALLPNSIDSRIAECQSSNKTADRLPRNGHPGLSGQFRCGIEGGQRLSLPSPAH